MSDRRVSGAELKVRVTGLGLTTPWLACRMGVNLRTVLRWYEAEQVPAAVVAEIDWAEMHTSEEMHRIAGGLRNSGTIRTRRTDADGCPELDTFPASWHRALTYRVLEYARSEGIPASVAYT